MPNLDSVPVTKYQPLHPYHHYFDNLPIESIETQLFLINAQVDSNHSALQSSIGNVGSLANRLNKSLEQNGNLKATAIDAALHSVSEHLDSGGFVRMTDAERSKLSLIESEATNVSVKVITVDNEYTWPDVSDTLSFKDSDTVAWRVEGSDIFADTTFSKTVITIPSYDVTPVSLGGTNYKTTSSNTPFKSTTLRVYINGIRLTKSPTTINGYYYAEIDPTVGTFMLNTTLESGDVIRIDFDRPIS